MPSLVALPVILFEAEGAQAELVLAPAAYVTGRVEVEGVVIICVGYNGRACDCREATWDAQSSEAARVCGLRGVGSATVVGGRGCCGNASGVDLVGDAAW